MQTGEIRRKTPEERAVLRAGLFDTIKNQVGQAAEKLKGGPVQRLKLPPTQQQNADTCLFACVIAIKRAIAERTGKAYLTPEDHTASQAREAGVLRNGGIFPNQETQAFLKEAFNLDTQIVGNSAPASVKMEAIVSALEKGQVPLLSYTLGGSLSHWIALDDIRRVNGEIEVTAMNPMFSRDLETMTDEVFAQRLIEGEHTPGGTGSGLMIVQIPPEALQP